MELQATAQAQTQGSTHNTVKFPYTYNFKTISEKKLREIEGELDSPIPEGVFDEVKNDDGSLKGYKRKPVTVELEAPAWIEGLPDLAQNILKGYIADFVKAQFVDQFSEVGAHDWESIQQYVATSSRRGGIKLEIADETWKEAAESFNRYFMEVIDNKQAADRLGNIMAGKFSKNAINKNANEFSEQICSKLRQRVDDWAGWAAEHEENADDFADVYTFVTSRLDKHLVNLQEANVNLADIL